jgi:hypothetical protein
MMLPEILKYFAKSGLKPENNWAFSNDQSSFGLDHTSPDGTKFWLDLNDDNTITVFRKPIGPPSGSLCFKVGS